MKFNRSTYWIWPVKEKFEILFPLVIVLITSILYTMLSVEFDIMNFFYQVSIMLPVIVCVHLVKTQLIILNPEGFVVVKLTQIDQIKYCNISNIIIKEYVTESKRAYSLLIYTDIKHEIHDIECFKRKDVEELMRQSFQSKDVLDALNYIKWYGT